MRRRLTANRGQRVSRPTWVTAAHSSKRNCINPRCRRHRRSCMKATWAWKPFLSPPVQHWHLHPVHNSGHGRSHRCVNFSCDGNAAMSFITCRAWSWAPAHVVFKDGLVYRWREELQRCAEEKLKGTFFCFFELLFFFFSRGFSFETYPRSSGTLNQPRPLDMLRWIWVAQQGREEDEVEEAEDSSVMDEKCLKNRSGDEAGWRLCADKLNLARPACKSHLIFPFTYF